MPNEIIFIIELVVCFLALTLINKFLNKEGLIAWIAIASILANVMTAKTSDLFGISYTLGTILFASTFLATDMITERFGKEDAKKGVIIGMVGTLSFIVASQICLWYKPTDFDYANPSMQTLFSLNLRISISSVIMYFIANMVDVYIYDALKRKMNNKHMWLRNNVATIICNTLENFFFMFGAFFGIYDNKTILMMAITTSLVEIVVGLCDTPFLYLSTKLTKKETINE